jgi:hypothetical protein
MMAPASRVLDLAHRIGRLRPDWRNPETYFHNRSEIEHDLKRLARELREHAE